MALLYVTATFGKHNDRALIDSGASVDIISLDFAQRCGTPLQLLPQPCMMELADGSPLPVTHYVQGKVVVISADGFPIQSHATLVVAPTPGGDVVLGYPWLAHNNPIIHWPSRKILGVWPQLNKPIVTQPAAHLSPIATASHNAGAEPVPGARLRHVRFDSSV